MRGEFLPVWDEMWPHVWVPLARVAKKLDHPDLYCELYRELNKTLIAPKSVEDLADITDNIDQARRQFRKTKSHEIRGEGAVVSFLESSYEAIEELGGDSLANTYYVRLEQFLLRFSLRYDLRRPCSLCPTLPGVFASLVRDLRSLTSQDAHLDSLMKDFENAIRDLHTDCSDGRIKTCIQKEINLLEAIGRAFPGVTETELKGICNQVGTWPHNAVKASLKNLYGFTSDYPGIRHGGTPASALRSIETRDMIAMTILLVGFTPYLTDLINADVVYRGS
jgi:hypothetical protein